jgi:hypothetical protein
MTLKRLRSMFNLSLQAASELYGIFNAALILGGVLAVVGTVGVFWTGEVRQRYADERISHNEADTARAKEGAARANEAAAKARLETETIKSKLAWRELTTEQADAFSGAISAAPGGPGSVSILYRHNDPEAENFAMQLNRLFVRAKWQARWEIRDDAFISRNVDFGIIMGMDQNLKAKAIQSAFRAAKTNFSMHRFPSMPGLSPTDATVLIATRPPPF